ncbi:MAG TPA: cytochrome c peroxidase, partial [Verrucomicrobiales bacterium]|nr:cytochrome c peroxidase [Verrucomicrobiales bacterium]
MNAKPTPTCRDARILPLAVAILATALPATAQLPDGSSLQLTPGGENTLTNLEITDPGDHSWLMQTSTNLVDWTTTDTCKVHNGRYRVSISKGSAPSAQFYRAVYDPLQQTTQSTVASALLLPATAANYANPALPPSFLVQPITAQDNTPANNPVTNAGATLGRVLFYDKRLSLNHTISCSSCHQQLHGFSDPNRFSTGFTGGLTGRNSMGLANARWYQRRAFF